MRAVRAFVNLTGLCTDCIVRRERHPLEIVTMPGAYDIISGAIDLHCHAGPDIFKRPFDMVELALDAKARGMRAILIKNHFMSNADTATIVTQHIDGVSVFGGITLNHPVGGLNAQAVYAAARVGAKEVKLPSMHSVNHLQNNHGHAWAAELFTVQGGPNHDILRKVQGISVLDEDGKLVPQMRDIFDIIKSEDMILSTGHIGLNEMMVVVREAHDAGLKKICVNHVENYNTRVPVDMQAEFARLGAYMEHCFNCCMPFYYMQGRLDPEEIVHNIKEVGPAHSVLGTDFGQAYNPCPSDGMRFYAETLLKFGVSRRDIEVMIKDNPTKLLGL